MIVVKTIKTYESDKSYDFYRLKEDSWSGALQTLEDIENANMEEEFMEHLDQIFGYEEEIEDVTLNDYIWFERDSIYQSLGLNENGELIEE
jgi:hypothetical protein